MKSNYLIFPMVLTDSNYIYCIESANVLTSLNFERLSSLNNCKQNIIYHLAKAIIDLQELVRNRNNHGYRYNSYLLNMVLLKLTFIAEIIESKGLPLLKNELIVIKQIIKDLHFIIDSSHAIYQS